MNSWEPIILRMTYDQRKRFELDIRRLVDQYEARMMSMTEDSGEREEILAEVRELNGMLEFLESLKRIDESDMISECPAELNELLTSFGVMEVS